MKPEHSYRLLLLAFGLTAVCLSMTAAHGVMTDLLRFWLACCSSLPMLLPVAVAPWLTITARTAIAAVGLVGVYTLVRRLWQTRRFLLALNLPSSARTTATLPVRLASLCTPLGLSHHIIVLPTTIPVAFCFGLLRPRICVSIGLVELLSDKELKAVLLHEEYHRRQYDPLRTLVADVLATLFFFLPVATEWRTWFLTASELAADRHAASQAGRFSLAGALYKLLTHAPQGPIPVSAGGISSFSITDARIAQLLDDVSVPSSLSRPRLIQSTFILILGCLLLQAAFS